MVFYYFDCVALFCLFGASLRTVLVNVMFIVSDDERSEDDESPSPKRRSKHTGFPKIDDDSEDVGDGM